MIGVSISTELLPMFFLLYRWLGTPNPFLESDSVDSIASNDLFNNT